MLFTLAFSTSLLAEPNDGDPWQKLNRKTQVFNDTLDTYFLKPLAEGYAWVLPQAADDAVTRFYHNLGSPRDSLMALTIGDWQRSAKQLGRFLTNSTVGVAGFFDVAKHLKMPREYQDLGMTLGYFGASPGPYFVMPFMGPANVRDGFARIPESFLYPQNYIDDDATRYGVLAVGIIDLRADLLPLEKSMQGDRYLLMRDVYTQRRAYLVKTIQAADEFDDDFGSDDFDAESEGGDDAW